MHPNFEPLNPGELEVQLMINLENILIDPQTDISDGTVDRSIRGDIAAGVRLLGKANFAEAGAQPADPDIQVELTATFRCEYSCANRHQVSDKAIREFLTHNAKFNVWPYWREFVQTNLGRAQVPNITLPLMVIKPTKRKPDTPIASLAPESASNS